MQFAKYIRVSIAQIYGTLRPRISSYSSWGRKMVILNIKWPINHWSKFYSYGSASGLPLYILTDEQEFHLESVQLASQNKIIFYQDFSSRIHSLYNWRFLWTLQEFQQDLTYTAIIANRDSHSLTHGQIWILLKSFLKIFAKTIVPHAPRLL